MPTTQAEWIAYQQGYEAAVSGGKNPYHEPGLKQAWNDGFEARLDHEM